jgi:hypothetical protein
VAKVVGPQCDERAFLVGAEYRFAGAVPDSEDGEGGEVVGAAFADEQASVGGVPNVSRC